MDQEEILNTISEVQHELAKVNRKLNALIFQIKQYQEVFPELEDSVLVLQEIKEEIYETIEIEKWVIMNSVN
jgi:hypothetical protein